MSTISQEDDVAQVFARVEAWPEEARRSLVEKIRGTFREGSAEPERRKNFMNLLGLLKTDGPPPTDEEVDQMLHDARMERFGA